jgi:hypothetical protein
MKTASPFTLSQAFVQALKKESDRACAILGLAMLDAGLRGLFEARLTQRNHQKLFEAHGPLATFAGRTDVAGALGWLPAPEHSELTLLRRIRNDFAHAFDHELTFASSQVRDRCKSLRFPQLILDRGIASLTEKEREVILGSPRRRFEVSVGTMCWVIDRRIKASTHAVDEAGLK